MGDLVNFVTPLHQETKRDYLGRMVDEKVQCMLKAKEYEEDMVMADINIYQEDGSPLQKHLSKNML